MADCELNHYTPLQSGMNGLYQTQYEASDLESLGLLKMDILGLRNLNIIHQVLDEVKKRYNTKISLSNLNLNDHNVYTLFRKGDTTGIFQFESDGIRKVLRDLKTSSFTDIIHAVSLYRPGPMQMIPLFVNRKFGEKYEILHPDLKDILAPTYGTIVFQEQIMLIARTFAGYTLGEADILRRAVSKKKADVLEKERTKFVSASISKGYNEKLANEIYDYIEKFANYGFNKSHAVSYSLIAYWMAYLKTYYFPCFMSALMTNSIGSVSSLQQYVIECKKRNLEIFPPSIQESDEGFVYKNKGIYYSLLGITNVGNVAVKEILKEREKGQFTSFENFVYRTKNFLTKRMVINLIYAGSFDCFHHSRKSLVNIYDEVLEKSFYVNSLGNRLLEINYNEEEYTFEEISFHEKEALGFNLKYNLFLPYQSLKKEKNMTDLISLVDGRRYIILFTIDRIKEIQTKNNEKMAFLDIHDDTNNISAVLFSLAYKQYQPILIVGNIYYGECKTDTRNNQLQVIIDRLTKLT